MRIPSCLYPLTPRSALASKRKRPAPRHLMLEVLEARDCPSGGLLDPTFNGSGTETFSTSQIIMDSTAVQPDGKIVAVGHVIGKKGASELEVLRLNPDGTPDKTFNGTGSETLTVLGEGDAVAFQPDGKILVGGVADPPHTGIEYAVTRLNANGSLDTTFGTKGVWTLNLFADASESVSRLAVLTDPNNPSVVTGIIVGGRGEAADGTPGAVVAIKLTPNGALDSTFGSSGVFTFGIGIGSNTGNMGMAVSTSGEIFLANSTELSNPDGTNTYYGLLVDVNPTGHLNTAFNGTGYLLDNPGGSTYTEFHAVAIQGNALVVAGDVVDAAGVEQGLVARYTLGGAVDPTFGSSGYYITTFAPPLGLSFTDLKLEGDGSIVVCGWSQDSNPGLASLIVGHLSADGAVDTSFGSSGTGFTYLANWGAPSTGERVSIGPDGKIVVNGSLEIARYTAP
ncbi:MAG TPA: delta-60 repeat domain-containing protein [Gemmataceae bacterium]|nr:delta-60 repeat domain-containing protein [Gemmataceae bacterium]